MRPASVTAVLLLLLAFACLAARASKINFVFAHMLGNSGATCNSCNGGVVRAPANVSLTANLTVPFTCGASTAATGNATLVLLPATGRLEWVVVWSGLAVPVRAALLRGPAYPSQTGAVQVDLAGSHAGVVISALRGSTYITQQQATQLQGGLWYVELQTDACASALRGQAGNVQTFPASPVVLSETLQLTCGNSGSCALCGTSASAVSLLRLRTDTGVLEYTVTYSMPGAITALSLRGPVDPPTVGPVAVALPFNASSNPIAGSVTLTDVQTQLYAAGQYYLQLESAGCALGVRGFIGSGFVVNPGPPEPTTTTTLPPVVTNATSTVATSTSSAAATTTATTTAAAGTTTAATTTAAAATTTPNAATTTASTVTSAPPASTTTTATTAAATSTTAATASTTAAAGTTTTTETATSTGTAPPTTTRTTTTARTTAASTTTSASRCPSRCTSPPPPQDRNPATNPGNFVLRTVQITSPNLPTVWSNTTVNAANGTLVALNPPVACATAGLQLCRVYVDFTASDFELLGATLQGLNGGANACALSTNDPQGFFFFDGDSSVVGPQRTIYTATARRNWNNGDRSAGDVLCGSYVTVAQGPENNAPYCVSSPVAAFWNTDGTLAPGATWFCPPDASNLNIKIPTAAVPPNGPGNSLLLAQFTVRTGYTVSGSLILNARRGDSTTLLQTTQSFQCFCP